MAKKPKNAISPTRLENYPDWYQQIIKAADLAEISPVRGCMVIKPWGYALWENMQKVLDAKFKETGHKNAYFPLLIPVSFLQKESDHIEGFAKECAVVTHSKLEADENGKLVPASPLEEPLIIRPTSETIIGEVYSKWVQSYRDLPLLINQWANVVRWEMRTRLFLRTSEFLWQEGHTVHATSDEAVEETEKMLDVYEDFAENYMAMPVIKGEKTEGERFPGAVNTYCIESMMQDGKALQAGTSHFLGQNFSKASKIKFLSKAGEEEFAWTTSWGVSTRLIGGLIMTHSDDDGLVLPPRLAPSHIVILPVIPKEELRDEVIDYCDKLSDELSQINYANNRLEIEVDDRDIRGGEKKWQWVKKGIPLIVEVGPRDIKEDSVFVARRDTGEKTSYKREAFLSKVVNVLEDMQQNLLSKARKFNADHTFQIDSKEEIYNFFKEDKPDDTFTHGGFVECFWAGNPAIEDELKKDLKITIRCIPLEKSETEGTCPFTGTKTKSKAIIARSY